MKRKIMTYGLLFMTSSLSMNAYAGIEQGKMKADNCDGCHGLNSARDQVLFRAFTDVPGAQ